MRVEADESGGHGTAAWIRAGVECLLVTAVFAAAGAWPVPDVNEAVYLTKARHCGDPAWAAGDFFLETPDAHGVFYLLMGPLAAAVSLEQAAWCGRVAGWLLLAIGFRHAVVPLLASGWARVVAALAFSLALRTTTVAGEWVIGGCEAKVFAWSAVIGGLGEVAAGRFASAVCRCGIATAFHPLVGGWALIATVATWGVSGGARGPITWRAGVLVAVGLLAAAVGAAPAVGLMAGVDPAMRAEATRIYVAERLPHHLLPRTFAEALVARHVLAAASWWLLGLLLPPLEARTRITAFTGVALAISLAGVGISILEAWSPTVAFSLLRYYWFRLADVAVPFALATTLAAALFDESACSRLAAGRPAVLRAAVGLVLVLDLAGQWRHWPLPGRAEVAARCDANLPMSAWREVCGWVRDHTPADACFLTPRGAASFTWRTGRREVVSWKNSPQDAASLVAWRQRIVDCFSRDGSLVAMERSTAALGPERVRECAARYGADHAIVPLAVPLEGFPGRRLFTNDAFAVYRLDEAPAVPPTGAR